MTSAATVAELQLAIVQENSQIRIGAKVLDLGCGNGDVVQAWRDLGYQAYGCDFKFKQGERVERLLADGRISLIEQKPYRLPYPNQTFDVIITNQVMEHVADYSSTLAEIRRILKPEGCCLHIFPSRGVLIEPHVFIPFATILQNRQWIALWALLGLRRASQRGLTWRRVAEQNYSYLRSSTNYLTAAELRVEFSRHFQVFRYVEKSFLRHSPNARGRWLNAAGRVLPVVYPLYRRLWSRVIFTAAPVPFEPDKDDLDFNFRNARETYSDETCADNNGRRP